MAATIIESARPAIVARRSTLGALRPRITAKPTSRKKKPIRSGLERIGEIAKGVGSCGTKERRPSSSLRSKNYFFFEDFFLAVFLAAFFFAGIGDHLLLATDCWLSRHTRKRNVNS